MPSIRSRLRHAWNVFLATDPQDEFKVAPTGVISYDRGGIGRHRLSYSNERSIIASIYTRIAVDASGANMRHVRVDDQDRYLEDIDSGLNNCLRVEANLDQAGRQFRQNIVAMMLDKGVAALVPVVTTSSPVNSNAYDVLDMRVGEVISWYPRHVKVRVYNEAKGVKEDIVLEKKFVSIIPNPFYDVMNEPNSTLQRLVRKLNMLDAIDEQSSSGKLDLIIQLPYVVKSEARRQQAEQRRTDIEFQLKDSKYGVAYTDGTEKITQLNRPATNNLLDQIKYLTEKLYGELGLTPDIMNGTADEAAMLNYNNRTIEPILTAITEAVKRTFLSKTARSQGQSVMFFQDPFKYVAMSDMAEIADKFTRNEIVSANEIRQGMGLKPSKDPNADKLRNANMPEPAAAPQVEQNRPPIRVQASTTIPRPALTRAPSEP